ncbi:hypothetical protein BKA67DRAFT_541589 [Truncatella angustata]|uniref:Uncharacterized protein n=1 Tax=Truncatella angustata TaxID=152316 RepID=A0A9P8RL86_9PEZI|nr:uncharacterized protein BKA67DRAFT_541589 [Truncatella angustata]KAH6645360.1 hypothetical protein BKA67DRAFT_541589 [Truncatella angustata]KAH8200311.1 hypothetical protein TruAng_005527 [Truncatella angustata]
MSGVKNLRAMFEQKHDTSPPDRGRSPGPGTGPGTPSFGSPTPSSRPLSKVRTNFIAVEKDGRVGLARDPSRDSVSASSRRLSNETESITPAPLQENNDPFSDNMANNLASFKTNLANDPIPESPAQSSPGKSSPEKGTEQGAETPEITPCPNPDKIVDEEESQTKLTPADPTVKTETNGKSNGLHGTPEAENKPKHTTTTTKSAPKTAAPITTSAKTASKPLKSPLPPKTPKSPAKEAPTAKVPERKPAAKATTPKAAAPRSRSTASSDKKPGAPELSPSASFVRAKPKSPTRPVQLPSRLTAPTTASASKLGSSALPRGQSQTRAPGNTAAPTAAHRPASRVSTATAGTSSSGKTLKRQASTVGRARPSLGPPPKLPSKDHPPVRKDGHQVDEGFLARMMRPTASSASKTSDKTPVTPPRKQAAPAAIKKPIDSAKKATAKLAETIKKDSTVKKQPVVAKAEVKKTAPSKIAKPAEPTAKEVAPVTAQAESPEAAVEAAKTSGDTAVEPIAGHQETEADVRTTTTTPDGEPKVGEESTADDVQTRAPADNEESVVTEEPEAVGEAVAAHNDASPSTETTAAPELKEDPLFDAEAVPLDADKVDSLNHKETTTDNVPQVEGEKQLASTDKEAVPAIAADPAKVEDIEDVVQETTEQTAEKAE